MGGSSMCTVLNAWQRINIKKCGPELIRREITKAMVHISFTMKLYKIGDAAGRHFLHEHPTKASSWENLFLQVLL